MMEIISSPDLIERLGEPELDSAITMVLRDLIKDETAPEWLREDAKLLGQRKHAFRTAIHPSGQGLVLRAVQSNEGYGNGINTSKGGRESRVSGPSMTLKTHSELARHIAEAFGFKLLPSDLRGPLTEAAYLHDLGKADRRFQAILHGGDVRAAAAESEQLAKSDWYPNSRTEYEKARIRSGYPAGGRHELLSVRLAEQIKNMEQGKELTLHLIASHHGRCRPFAPAVFDPDPPDVTIEWNGSLLKYSGGTGLGTVDSAVAERFWKEVRRLGWWGEAYLETLTRLADHRSSVVTETKKHTINEGTEEGK
jgi:CRISPR-associated endonuclease/helicase Cas3